MAHGLNTVMKRPATAVGCKSEGKTGIGSRRIFAPHFKLQVLDSYRNDADCKGNQRATARKYGIHRRQIQKWLQVEGNLRNSVRGRAEEAVNGNKVEARQRGDDRVPALPEGAPLDCTTRPRRPSAPELVAPMDLSLKRPAAPAGASSAPAVGPPSPLRQQSPPSLAQPHPDVWDLSTNKRKCEPDPLTCTPKPPVKLFKPYLLDDGMDTSTSSSDDLPPPHKLPKIEPPNPHQCCILTASPPHCDYYYTTNNNNIVYCDIKAEYPSPNTSYTLHELQPKSYFYPTSPYHHPNNPAVEYENGLCHHHHQHPGGYDEHGYPGHPGGGYPLKQRHSYSLDFKLSAIECYYQDSVCKGNQRAVASKFQIHRRQVQKWLKQEDELRQKNESSKITEIAI